jgi:hypothetical protein
MDPPTPHLVSGVLSLGPLHNDLTVSVPLFTVIRVDLPQEGLRSARWTEVVSTDHSVLERLATQVGTDGGTAGEFRVVSIGTARLVAINAAHYPRPTRGLPEMGWRATIVVSDG